MRSDADNAVQIGWRDFTQDVDIRIDRAGSAGHSSPDMAPSASTTSTSRSRLAKLAAATHRV
jgi:hypothetical protein